jgi:hypothetical protein
MLSYSAVTDRRYRRGVRRADGSMEFNRTVEKKNGGDLSIAAVVRR